MAQPNSPLRVDREDEDECGEKPDREDRADDGHAAPVTLCAPDGGEAGQVGRPMTVSWSAGRGARLVGQRVLLSTDGGASFRPVSPELGGTVRSYIFMPTAAMVTARARIRVAARDGADRCAAGESDRDFAITLAAPRMMKTAGAKIEVLRPPGIPLPGAPPRRQAAVALLASPASVSIAAGELTVSPAAGRLPAIAGFQPMSGPPGSHVRIRGANLGGSLMVELGGVPAPFVVVSDSLVVATVPPEAVTGRIALVSATATATSADDFIATPTATRSV